MQCPLCRESVADDNALQVHYLMSCLGYLENPSTNQQKQAPPSKKVVQFRWVKTKPTLAREVYLISSVAGSVKLEWRPIDECFLSDQVEVPQGLHVCQLIVDADAMSTDDFNVSDTSRTIDVLISKASEVEESTGNTSGGEDHEPQTQHTSPPDHTDEQDGRSEVTTQQLPSKGSLYRELIKHQILHGDSLETLAGDSSSGQGHQRDRTRGNGVATRNSRDQRSTQGTALGDSTGVHLTRTGGGHTARSDISDLPNERQGNDVLRDSLSSDELQQFLQPTRTRQESNGDAGNADVVTTEERESSLSDNEEHSASLSSHEGLERRPELLGQSNGETESRVQPDTPQHGISDQDPDVDGSRTRNHEESISDHRQETLLVDLREPSSGRDREGSSMGRRDQSGNDRERTSDDHREGSSRTRRQVPLDKDRGETYGDLPEQSSVNDRRRLSDDSRERSSSSRRKQSSRNRRGQSSGDGREPSGNNGEPSKDNCESSGSHREPSANNHEPLGGDNREPSEDNRDRSGDNHEPSEDNREQSSSLRTEASSDLRQETSSGLQERTSTDNHDPKSVDRQERTSVGRREGTSGDERRKETESQDNRSNPNESPSSVNINSYLSLPTTLYPDLTQITRTEALINTHRTTVQSGLLSGDLIPPRGSGTSLTDSHGLDSQTRGLISPRSSATSLTGRRGLDSENNFTGSRGLEDSTARTTTDDLLFRRYSTGNSALRTNTAFTRDTITSSRDFAASTSDSGPSREISTQSRETSGPSREINTQSRETSGPSHEINTQSRDVSGPNREINTRSRDVSGPSREISTQSRDTSGPNREISTQSRDTSGPNREMSTQSRDTSGPSREMSAQRRDTSGPNREMSTQSRDTSGPNREMSAQRRDTSGPSREMSAQRRDVSGPSLEINTQSRDVSGPSREISTRNRDIAQNGDISAPSTEMSYLSRDTNASRKGNRYQQSGVGGDILALTRRSPQGSFMDDSGIRRPPLYTSAPSRPYSSLPYRPHTAISPLSSPQDGEVAVSSSSSLGPSAVSVSNVTRATTVTTQSMLDRGAPTGSALSPEGAEAATSGRTASSKQFSEDGIKELLESLKKTSSRRKISPETSPRERLGASEISSLKQKLVDRDDAVKKLKAKNTSYKEKIEQLREKEIELTKALSLAETSQKALKEQEEISSELENALGEKEKQYAELEVKVLEMKREKRRMEGEFEQGKKDYEKKIHDLRKINASLGEEVKTLRENRRQTSSKYSNDYKKLLEECQEYLAVSASLKDQVQTLQKENKDLKEKLKILSTRSRQENLTSYSRDHYPSRTDINHQDHSSINGYLDTNASPTFIGRRQFDSLPSQTDTLRQYSGNDRHLLKTTRESTSNTRYPYDSDRPVLENSRSQPESTDHRTNRSRPLSETTRTYFESQLDERVRDRPESRRDRSDIYGSESSEISPRVERSRSRESRSRRRLTTADDVTSRISDPDYRYLLPKRSHSSDPIRNEFPDATRSKISPSQERGSQELDRRSKDRSRLYHSGSYDNLNSRSSTQTRDLTLTGHRVDPAPTSPDPTSPRSERRSSPGKGSPFAPETAQQIDIGMIVLVSRHCGKLCKGIVQYVGYLPDKEDKVYVGLELHDADGKHDGKFNGQRFFKCKPNHGVFVLFEKIVMAYT